MGATNDFQIALYAALIADSTLLALINGANHIGDWPKPSGPFPWITIGEDVEEQWPNKDESNYRIEPVIDIWVKNSTTALGWKKPNQILDQLDVILLENLLTLDAGSRFSIIGKGQRPTKTRKFTEDNGRIRRIRAVYKFWISC